MAAVKEEVEDQEVNTPSKCTPTAVNNAALKREDVALIAQKLSSQSVKCPNPSAWGVLTAISDRARRRPQGMHIFLYEDYHVLGRTVRESSFRFDSANVSANHCKLYKILTGKTENSSDVSVTFSLKDTSSNGTFVNWEKLKRNSEANVHHGDIVSLVSHPENENAFAFVFREIKQDLSSAAQNLDATNTGKRKISNEDIYGEYDGKRLKGLGNGPSKGPVSLDDVRNLERSNKELREELEKYILKTRNLEAEAISTGVKHENDLKRLDESVSASYSVEIQDLKSKLAVVQKELDESKATSTDQDCLISNLKGQLNAAQQSHKDAEETINICNAEIEEVKKQLEEEKRRNSDEREKVEMEHKAAVERVRAECAEEIDRLTAAAMKKDKERMELISQLQESEKENKDRLENKRLELDKLRKDFTDAKKRVLELEVKLHEEEKTSSAAHQKIDEQDREFHKMRKQLEDEKAEREKALAEVSKLEHQMVAAIRDLELEKQRLQGARERIVLRENQIRSFHSTAEEIAALQKKQQEQLNGMFHILEDNENYELPNQNYDFHAKTKSVWGEVTQVRKEVMARNTGILREGNTEDSTDIKSPNKAADMDCDSDASSIKQCDTMPNNDETQEECSQEKLDCTKELLVHDTEPAGTMPNIDEDNIGTERILLTEPDNIGTERILLTEPDATQVVETADADRLMDRPNDNHVVGEYNGDNNGGETMEIDSRERPALDNGGQLHHADGVSMEKKDDIHSIATALLLASEVAGSWMDSSTVRSFHCDNESLRSDARELGGGRVGDDDMHQDFDASQVGPANIERSKQETKVGNLNSHSNVNEVVEPGSQHSSATKISHRHSLEHQALDMMIGIVAPDFKRYQMNNDIDDAGGTDEETDDETSDKGNSDNNDDDDTEED